MSVNESFYDKKVGATQTDPDLALRPVYLSPLWLALRPLQLALRPLQPALRPLQLALTPLQLAFFRPSGPV